MSSLMPDCTSKCRSLQHALDIISVVTRGREGQIKAFLTSHCYNAATSKDTFGRNAIHLASSCGKKGVLDWLAETDGVDLLVKDKESGWTALHRGIFYGHIDCAWSLLKHGVNLYIQDKEGLSALDLVMKDRPAYVVFKNTDPTDVYTWGNNINFTLGHGGQQSKHHPELVDLFPRNGVYIKQVVLCKFHSVFLSQKGQVYTCGHGQGGRLGHGDEQTCLLTEIVTNLQNPSNDDSSYETNNVYERIRLEKLAFVHRAVSVTSDHNGCNFAVLQSDPKTSLYEIPSVSASSFHEDFGKLLGEAEVMDIIHDVTFRVGARTFAVHKYILAMRSDFFRKLFVSDQSWLDPSDLYRKDEDDVGCDLYVIEKLHPDLFMYLLQYMYTDSCDLLIHGHRPKMIYKEKMEDNEDNLITNLNKITVHGDVSSKSAFEVYRSNQAHMVNEKQKSKPKSTSKKCKGTGEEVNLIKMLQIAAKKFGLGSLSSRLDGVRIENGRINVVSRKNGNKPKLNQKKCSFLCDVTMKSIDGKEFPCHKCVLCARLDYFHSMLSSSWIEASCCAALEMPFPSDILQVILDYIYTDEAVTIKEYQNVEFICNVLVVADQLLMLRLKEICEVAITEKLTLKNAAELLEFSATYNAEQLKQSCLQFIVLNMAAIFETRALDVLSDAVLKELSIAYRKMIPSMVRRVITPYQDGPDISSLEPEEGETFVFLKEEQNTEHASQEALLKKAKAKAKKKPRRRSDSSGGYNLSDIIQSPPSTGTLKLDKANSIESLPEMLMSDSEGSYVGVNSPRDLQSPDFTAGIHADKVEVKSVSSAALPQSNKEVKICEGRSVQNLSLPHCIPNNKNTSAGSSNWVIGSFSPASPPAMDLRTIMEIEENMQKCGSMPKINSGRPASHGNKLSQKQRKLIAMAAKENSPEIVPDAVMLPVPSKSGHVWASSSHSSTPKSFRDLLLEEKKIVGAHSGKVCAKLMESVSAQKILRCSTATALEAENEHICEPAHSENQNPWLPASLMCPAAATPITFAEIVEEELQQEAALVRSREKPLALIQIEERAIQDLLIHYQAVGNPDEFIVVERSPQGPIAAPMWNKH
ncbi:inhibitor of Bruton tyrosine kinase [Varanus komodoensis]|uniref:inhibitor of Bruton tyrosine kinase n=1 Tax=Varanus komodoensis TaxID=61221 RepID=UPI001CF7A77D|nr:inhibitor of Bruton tyrosine kinase [Varanus komodoensis]